jgi:hypothetical protein
MERLLEIRRDGKGRLAASGPHRSSLREFLRLHNPFYLISAACMLLGCYLVAGAVTGEQSGARLSRVLVMIGALNVYELLLVALSCFLIAKKRQLRDGLMILAIEVLLLADSTNLLHETFALSFRVGLASSAAALLLAGAKATAVIWVLKLRFSVRELVAGASGYVGMLLVPAALTAINSRGWSMVMPVHAAWWFAGLLPLGLAVLLPRPGTKHRLLEGRLGALALGAPWISMLAHLLMASWQYGEVFHFANLAPVLIGWGGVALWRRGPIMPRSGLHAILGGCGALSLLVTAFAATELQIKVPIWGNPVYSPLRATLLAVGLLYVWAAVFRAGWSYAGAGAVSVLGFLSGHSLSVITTNWIALGGEIVPGTKTGWGVLAVILAFAFLGGGALMSVLRKLPAEAAGRRTETGGA